MIVQFSHSVMSDSLRPRGLPHASVTRIHHQLPEFAQNVIEAVMPSNHLIICHSLLLLPSIFPSIRVFSNESLLRIMWPKYCSFRKDLVPISQDVIHYPAITTQNLSSSTWKS